MAHYYITAVYHIIYYNLLQYCIREEPASQPQSTLSCVEKKLAPLKKNSDSPNLGPKKPC